MPCTARAAAPRYGHDGGLPSFKLSDASEFSRRFRPSGLLGRQLQPFGVVILSARTGSCQRGVPVQPQPPPLRGRCIQILVEKRHEPLLPMGRQLAEAAHQRSNADIEKRWHGGSMRRSKRCLHPSFFSRCFHRTMSDCGGIIHHALHREHHAPPATPTPGPAPARSRRSRWCAPVPACAWPSASAY